MKMQLWSDILHILDNLNLKIWIISSAYGAHGPMCNNLVFLCSKVLFFIIGKYTWEYLFWFLLFGYFHIMKRHKL